MVGKNIEGSNNEIDKVISTFVKEYVKKYKPSAKAQHKVLAHAQDNDRLDTLKKQFEEKGKKIVKEGNKFIISDIKNDNDTKVANTNANFNENDFRDLSLLELPSALVKTYFEQYGYSERWKAQLVYNASRLTQNKNALSVMGLLFVMGLERVEQVTPEFVSNFIFPIRGAIGATASIQLMTSLMDLESRGDQVYNLVKSVRDRFIKESEEEKKVENKNNDTDTNKDVNKDNTVEQQQQRPQPPPIPPVAKQPPIPPPQTQKVDAQKPTINLDDINFEFP